MLRIDFARHLGQAQRELAELRELGREVAKEQILPRVYADIARVLAKAHVDCYCAIGPEWHAISAALKGNEEMERFQQSLIDRYVAIGGGAAGTGSSFFATTGSDGGRAHPHNPRVTAAANTHRQVFTFRPLTIL